MDIKQKQELLDRLTEIQNFVNVARSMVEALEVERYVPNWADGFVSRHDPKDYSLQVKPYRHGKKNKP